MVLTKTPKHPTTIIIIIVSQFRTLTDCAGLSTVTFTQHSDYSVLIQKDASFAPFAMHPAHFPQSQPPLPPPFPWQWQWNLVLQRFVWVNLLTGQSIDPAFPCLPSIFSPRLVMQQSWQAMPVTQPLCPAANLRFRQGIKAIQNTAHKPVSFDPPRNVRPTASATAKTLSTQPETAKTNVVAGTAGSTNRLPNTEQTPKRSSPKKRLRQKRPPKATIRTTLSSPSQSSTKANAVPNPLQESQGGASAGQLSVMKQLHSSFDKAYEEPPPRKKRLGPRGVVQLKNHGREATAPTDVVDPPVGPPNDNNNNNIKKPIANHHAPRHPGDPRLLGHRAANVTNVLEDYDTLAKLALYKSY